MNLLPRTEKQNKDYKNRDNDLKGPWKATPIHARSGSENGIYTITFSNGITWRAPQGRYPRYSKEKLLSLYNNNELYFNKNGGVDKKTYLSEVRNGITCGTFWGYEEVGHSHSNNEELAALLNKGMFSDPKGTKLLNKILLIGTNSNSLILDFFSGSATTAHAVMKLNAEDGGNRKYILVQLPEEIEESKPAFKAGYKTIDEIGRERIKRAAQKIKEETNADIDYGFKVVKLENIQEDTLDRLESFDPNVLVSDDYVNDFSNEDSSGLETILTTWLNQDGYGLHAKWQDFKLVNYIAHRYSNSLYIVNEGIESSDISRLIEMIENNELNISRIVIYTYSLPFTIINELKTNIKNLRNNKTVDIIERY